MVFEGCELGKINNKNENSCKIRKFKKIYFLFFF